MTLKAPLLANNARNGAPSNWVGRYIFVGYGGDLGHPPFDFGGLAGEKSVLGNNKAEAGGFFYQQAEYRNGQLTYDQGSLGEVGVEIPDVGAGGYGQVRTSSGTEKFVFGEGEIGKKGGFDIGAGALAGVEGGELTIGVFGDASVGPGAGGAGYFISLSTQGTGCHP